MSKPKAAEPMGADEYRAALEDIGYSQQQFARLIGASPRTGRKYALGETSIPGSVTLLLRLMRENAMVLAAVEAMPQLQTRSRMPPKSKIKIRVKV